jgi:integrase
MGSGRPNNPDYVTSFKDRHGKWRFYFRYRHQKFKLPGKPGEAAFHEAYARYLSAKEIGSIGRDNVTFINGTIGWCVEKYLTHDLGLPQHKPSTQRVYRLYCELVKREVGQFKISDLTPVAVRAMRDSVAKKHKTSVADMCVMMVSTLWKFAIEHLRQPLGHNPGVGIFKLHKQKRLTKRWSEGVIKKFSAEANAVVRLGFQLLLYTAQRESDVVKMQWSDIDWHHADGPRIHVKQRKTGERVWIPLHPTLRVVLEQTPRLNDFILNSERGEPYSEAKGLANAISRTLKDIGIEDHSGHGLRVTAACALKEAGCNDDEVAAVTGHTDMRTLRKYLREVERQRLARDAMKKRVAAGGR